MARKEKEPKAHQLYKQIPYGVVTYGDPISPGEPTSDTTSSSGWEVLTGPLGTYHHFVYRTYIDLSGWTREDLTTFTQGVDIQKPLIPVFAGVVPNLFEFDYITTRKITDDELTSIGLTGSVPSFSGNTLDLMQMVYGESSSYAINAQVSGTYVQVAQELFGSGNPVATDKLHWTRHMIVGAAAPASVLQIYPTNLIVQALTVEEKDLVWMERLRRSYVLQDQADV